MKKKENMIISKWVEVTFVKEQTFYLQKKVEAPNATLSTLF